MKGERCRRDERIAVITIRGEHRATNKEYTVPSRESSTNRAMVAAALSLPLSLPSPSPSPSHSNDVMMMVETQQQERA
jgi:hypothetical protein